MDWIPIYRARTGLICTYLTSIQLERSEDLVNKDTRIRCDHRTSGDFTIEDCKSCKTFHNVFALFNGPTKPGFNTELDAAQDLLKRTSSRIKSIQDETQLKLLEPADNEAER
jgi:hypothetical protein